MSTNETIRAMLEERGIAYKALSTTCTEAHINGIKYTFYEDVEPNHNLEGKVFALTEWLTPEQVIAAMVGVGTCKNVSTTANFRCSECDATDLDFDKPTYCHGCGRKVVSE